MGQRFAKFRFGTVTTGTGRNILLNICFNACSPNVIDKMRTFKYSKMSHLADSCDRGEHVLPYGRKGYISSYFGTALLCSQENLAREGRQRHFLKDMYLCLHVEVTRFFVPFQFQEFHRRN